MQFKRLPKRLIARLSLFSLVAAFAACGQQPQSTTTTSKTEKEGMKPSVKKESFGKLPDGTTVDSYTLTNKNGVEVKITNYGGIVVSLTAPDRNRRFADVVLGFNDLESYLKGHPYFGSIIGRYGNRIAKGRFSLNGVEHKLAVNNGPNHLHGGIKGFDKIVWTPGILEVTVFPGTSSTSSVELAGPAPTNTSIFVTPEIGRFLSVNTTGFVHGQKHAFPFKFEVPSSTKLGTYSGTVHLRDGKRTVPAILKVIIHVVAPSATTVPRRPAASTVTRCTSGRCTATRAAR